MSFLGNMQIRENISSKKIRVGNSNESKNTNISVSAKISSNKIQKILYIKYGEFWSLPIALELFIEHKPPEIGNNLLQVQLKYLISQQCCDSENESSNTRVKNTVTIV